MIQTAERTPTRHCEAQPKQSRQRLRIAASPAAPCNDVEEVNLDQDRLSHAKKFAAELSESRLREMAKTYRQRWTPAKRAEKAKIIHIVKPWMHATGPKSGKHAKGAGYADKAVKRALKEHRQFLNILRHLPYMTERDKKLVYRIGQAATLGLITALALSWCVTERNNE